MVIRSSRRRSGETHPIDAPGTDERTWAAWPWLSTLPGSGLAALGRVRSAVILAAHPDDEVLGAGGLISMLAASQARLRVVAVTDGDRSHQGRVSRSALARRRTAETTAALHALGARSVDIVRLGLPDTGLAAREQELTAAVAPLVAGFDLCLAPWDGDLHADHEAVGRAARATVSGALYQFPVWMWHWATPGDPRVSWGGALRIPLPPGTANRKRAAIGCFASQLEDRGRGLGPVLTPGMVAHFTRTMEVLLP